MAEHTPATTLLTTAQVAAQLGVSPRQVRYLAMAGELRTINIGRGRRPVYRISENALRMFKERRASGRRIR